MLNPVLLPLYVCIALYSAPMALVTFETSHSLRVPEPFHTMATARLFLQVSGWGLIASMLFFAWLVVMTVHDQRKPK